MNTCGTCQRLGLVGSLFALMLAIPLPAAAQPQEYGPYRRPAQPEDDWDVQQGSRSIELAHGDYVHDGFYMRFAGGVGGGSDKLNGSGRSPEGSAGELDGTVSGFAGATQVALGFTPVRGWVLGMAIDTVTIPGGSGSLTSDTGRFEFKTSQLALFGALIDFYPDPLRGFHVQASAGLASYVMAQGTAEADRVIAPPHVGVGAGFSLGVGNQWWVHPEWTIGVLPRLVLGWASGNDEFGSRFRHRVVGYSLLLTTTYH